MITDNDNVSIAHQNGGIKNLSIMHFVKIKYIKYKDM